MNLQYETGVIRCILKMETAPKRGQFSGHFVYYCGDWPTLTSLYHVCPSTGRTVARHCPCFGAVSIRTARRDRLRPQLQRFTDAFRQHIDVEENEIFPAAEKHLLDNDWYALRSGISYLESIHFDDKRRTSDAAPQPQAVEPVSSDRSFARYPQSVKRYVADQTERVTASVAMTQLFSAYTLAESIGGMSECVEELRKLGVKQAKAGVNEALNVIMACRDTSGGVANSPGKLLRTARDNFGDTWSETKHIVQKGWQQEQSLNSRVGLLQDIWRAEQPQRLRSH